VPFALVPKCYAGFVSIGLADKVAYLRSLCGAGDEAIETHFAWVFLVGERAFKLRKPVRRDTMDYGTLAARRADSEAEVRLNLRLAPEIYLRTAALVVDPVGRFSIGGVGETVDWLVEMRRVDRRLMLDAALERGDAGAPALARVAELLAVFYAAAEPAITQPGLLGRRLHEQVDANLLVLRTLDDERAAMLAARQHSILTSLEAELDRRVARGCVVEAHGDLRPEHILLSDPPAVIDCLEFDRNLRILDRAEELCFLELECARLGHAPVGRWLLEECLRQLSDDASCALLDYYRGHRSATRAKLYTWRAGEPDGGTPEQWRAQAAQYLAIALETTTEAPRSR
jgi:aminoglycoside phosphotransferase family enzyme